MDNHTPFLAMDISLAAIEPHKEAAIALAADRLTKKAGIAYGDVKAALMGREALGSTALGRGIAMPHAMVQACSRPPLCTHRPGNAGRFRRAGQRRRDAGADLASERDQSYGTPTTRK
ncbi:PTS sugar transporter subunit IIA [Shinella sp. S4-D37]|uniref:PTS sugar transporter subunit IIA n=1 Tax=Shinella sp. S4-D37 TaxID=3161999 RepID=UPI0034653549